MDTKPWWQSKIIITQLVAALFALLTAFNALPAGISQDQVISSVMTVGAVMTVIFRLTSKHTLTK